MRLCIALPCNGGWNLNNSGSFPVKGLLIGLALGLVMGALSGLSTLGILFVPAFLGLVLGTWGYGIFAGAVAVFALTVGLILGWNELLYVMCLSLPAAFTIGYVIKNKKPWRVCVSLCALLMGVGLYLYICLPDMLNGAEPFYSIRYFISTLREEIAASSYAASLGEDTLSYIVTGLVLYEEMADQLAMEVICVAAMLFALADTLIARAFAVRAGADVKKMTPMPLWQLSRNYTYAAAAAIIGAVVTYAVGLNNSALVVTAAEQAVLGPLALMGFCYLDFSTRLGRAGSKAKRVIIYILVILLPYRTNILAIVGLSDKIFKTRTRFVPNKNRKNTK